MPIGRHVAINQKKKKDMMKRKKENKKRACVLLEMPGEFGNDRNNLIPTELRSWQHRGEMNKFNMF